MSAEHELKKSVDALEVSMNRSLNAMRDLREDRDRLFTALSNLLRTHPEAPIPLADRRAALTTFERSLGAFGGAL